MSLYPAYSAEQSGVDRLVHAGRTVFAALVLTGLVMTFQPFAQVSTATEEAGNVINQLGYSLLAACAILGHLVFAERRITLTYLRPTWLLMVLWFLISSRHSIVGEQAVRAALFLFAAMTAVTGALALPPDGRSFRNALAFAALAVLALSYFGVIALPEAAIHQGWEEESQHAGLWRGIYSHKNVTGPIMAAFVFVGLYLFRSRQRALGTVIAILAGFFVFKTGSKTTLALMPAVAILVLSTRAFGSRYLPTIAISFVLIIMALFTLGTVVSPALDAVVQYVAPGTDFTGRMDIWRFALEVLKPRQWIGFGYESFWGTDWLDRLEATSELTWDPTGAANGHDGYLDIAIAIGWPGLAAALVMLVVQPFLDFARCIDTEENRRAADFFLMVLAFMLFNAFMESFFFARGNPIWMLTFLAIAGLRLTARHRIAEAAEP
ncbi:O-antigen ligase family protein [Consotaella salsifontis]|uniref:O-antigen ligase n=1 Tax=Consotaella salsifontis TaxID=1365950 RepID=A0A1T4TF52_9HYPH|nr:O-antigen ligase [Consotaella salsifontis]SKA39074.1 O-antigen ligase [Consotaella salsifontis]